jgi:arylsulfatase A-like enzyme
MAPLNIVFILMDDYGWRDTACYGSTFYETPNLDRLAAQGLRFTDAYAACPVCSPSRASILTGKYPARLGITDWIDWHGHCHPCRGRLVDAPYIKDLPGTEFTLAAALRAGGYQTWHVGKWHLGGPNHRPEQHGFDINVGGCEWGSPSKGYFAPWQIPVLPGHDVPPGTELTGYLTDRAISLIRGRDPARPFFLNFCHYAVHTPIQARAELVDKYRAKARRLKLDEVPAVVEGEPFPTEHKRRLRVQRRLVQSDPTYAALIETVDTSIGRLLDALEQAGLSQDTLVLFTSDNGGLATSEGSPTSNLPLNEGKGWMYEGGTREPLIARWPAVVQPGTICTEPVTGPDFYPTLLAAAGLPPRPEQHRDGLSFLPLLHGSRTWRRGPIFWHYPHYGNQGGTPGASVRDGDWKLIRFFEDDRNELYDLSADPGETRDLSAHRPAQAARLAACLQAWLACIGARLPEPNPDWSHHKECT